MAGQTIRKSSAVQDVQRCAEGRTGQHEMQELPYQLTEIPLSWMQALAHDLIGETGLSHAVETPAEGQETLEEQDAEHTRGTEGRNDLSENQETTMSTPNPYTKPILIVEDTVELAEVLQATLQSMGLTAHYETHGKAGLERLKELEPEILLMDIGLPDITGWQMLDSIKQHSSENGLKMPKIIVITAYGDPANRLVGKLQNVHSYLVKPFTPGQVENLINDVLGSL